MKSLKLLRLSLHMSTVQAARVLAARVTHPEGVSETTWIRWENGKKVIPSDLLNHLEAIRNQLQNALSSAISSREYARCDTDINVPTLSNSDVHTILAYHIQLAVTVMVYAQTGQING